MYRKEGGKENSVNSLEYGHYDKYEELSNQPLSGTDRVKIISYFIFLILPFFWLGISIIIILITIISLYIMRKDQSFKPIYDAKKYITIYLKSTIVLIFSIVYYVEILSINHFYKNLIFALGLKMAITISIELIIGLILMYIFNNLFFKPLEKHKNWVIKNGIFSDSTNIIGRNNRSSYSVADEILKWNKLLEKGLISKEEFERAREKLLNMEKD